MKSSVDTLISRTLRLAVVAATLVTIHSAAYAGRLTVTVLQANNNAPLAGAQVCLSNLDNSIGDSKTTNSQGSAFFDNPPQGTLKLTASASGFVGFQRSIEMGSSDRLESFTLQAGSGGPVCNVSVTPPPVTLSSLTLSPTTVIGGTPSQGTVTLSGLAPPGGTVVNLSSSNTLAATVPASVNVPAGSNSQTFTASTSQITSAVPVTITASIGGTSQTATLTVNPVPPLMPRDDTGQGVAPANLTVLVTRANGTVISGASVCVTPVTGPVRSGVTGLGGQAAFNNIPQGQVTITVSFFGFTGQSHTSTLPPGGGTARFILSEGNGGPVCTVTAPPPSSTPVTLAITSFDWHVNRRTPLFFEVAVAFAATRNPGGPAIPTHYRVGESSDLSRTPWIAYQGGLPLFELGYRGSTLTAYGRRTLFLQVKQGDLISSVASKSVDLQPLRISEFRLEGTDSFGMLTFAEEHGFAIRVRTISVTQNICPGMEFRRSTQDFGITTGTAKDRTWQKIVEVALTDSSAKRFTPGWRVRSIEIGRSPDPPGTQAFSSSPDGNGFNVVITLSVPSRPDAPSDVCLANVFPLRAIVLEGPGDDLALDQAKRWKNMFPN